MELKSLDLRKTYHPKTFKELSESQVSQLTDLGRSSPQSSGFANLKDTYAVHRLQQFRDSESSSSIELDKADDSAFQRSFRAIQGQRVGFTATDNIIDDDITESEDGQEKENNMAYNWEPSNAIQQEMMGISSSTKTKDWVNNTGVETTAMAGNDKLHLIPTATRESTPDSIGFSNQLTMGDNTKRPERTVNAANVQNNQLFDRQSMRNVLVERIETDATDLQFRDPALQAESGVNDQNIDEKDGGSMCLAKGIIFVLMVLALIGAIIGVTLYLKNEPSPKHEALGKVIPNEINHSECNTRRLSLGDVIVIFCDFDVDHEYRKNLIQVNQVVIDSPMKLNDDSFFYNITENRGRWDFYGPKARCTSEGRYDLKFYSSQSSQTIVYRTSVTVRLNDGDFTLSWSQRMVNNINGSTEFDVTCNTAGSCHNYDVDFIGKRQSYSAYELLNERKNCSSSFNDKDGRQISCTTQFDEATVKSFFGFIGCRVQDGNFVDYRALKLPACFQTTECNFNCSTKSPERTYLDIGGCSHSKIRRCFPAARPIFRRQVCPSDGDCSAYVEQYECRLGWCRSPTGVIYLNELVGDLLCGDFVAKIPRTLEITTTTPTTTKTTLTTTTTTPTTTTATPTTTTTTPKTTTTTPTTTTTQVRQTSSELS